MKRMKAVATALAVMQIWMLASCGGDITTRSEIPSEWYASSDLTSDASSDTVTHISSEEPLLSSEPIQSQQSVMDTSLTPSISSNESEETKSEISSLQSHVSSEHNMDNAEESIVLKGKLSAAELQSFDNAAFVGNSIIKGIYNYRSVPNAAFFTRTSLNVQTIYTTSTDTGRKPIMDMLDTRNGEKSFEKVFLLLGINEFGYSFDSFINLYGQLVEDMKVRQPDAEIYIISVFPVTKAYGKNNERNITPERILQMNGMIMNMCEEKGAIYLDLHSCLINSNGDLPSKLSTDGVHVNRNCSDHIIACIYDMVYREEKTE